MTVSPCRCLRRVVGDDLEQLLGADDVGEQRVADDERQAEEDGVLADLLANLAGRPRRLVQGALLVRVAFDEVFDLAEDHFHQHGLRAGPAAPQPAEGGGEDDDAGDEDQQRHREHDHVLRPEDLAEDDELALDDIDQEQRVAVDADERPGEHDGQQQPAQPGARRDRIARAASAGKATGAGPPGPPWPGGRGSPPSRRPAPRACGSCVAATSVSFNARSELSRAASMQLIRTRSGPVLTGARFSGGLGLGGLVPRSV